MKLIHHLHQSFSIVSDYFYSVYPIFSSDFLLLCFIPNSIQSTLFTSAIGENIPAADSILMEYLNTELLRPGTDVQQLPSAKRREPPPDAAQSEPVCAAA